MKRIIIRTLGMASLAVVTAAFFMFLVHGLMFLSRSTIGFAPDSVGDNLVVIVGCILVTFLVVLIVEFGL